MTFTDEQVAAVMRLLRRYHDTFGGDVICHGDFGPWNIVWRHELPFAVIDFGRAGVARGKSRLVLARRLGAGLGGSLTTLR